MARGWNVRSHKSISDSLNDSRDQFTNLLNVLIEKVNSLQKAAPPDSELSNRLFTAPQASKEFTGRAWLFNQIEEAFGLTSYTSADVVLSPHGPSSEFSPLSVDDSIDNLASSSESKYRPDDGKMRGGQKQKRFVLQGVPGSGKVRSLCSDDLFQGIAKGPEGPIRDMPSHSQDTLKRKSLNPENDTDRDLPQVRRTKSIPLLGHFLDRRNV